ncbi:MAG: glycosyltransferase family 2 protein [Clostridia bacterium]|nr:glycosyltransferase family 2 protein [Clostridia bacterium]
MIDVIIPAYNAHATICRTLHSIAMQTNVKNLCVTIVDDCSPDGGYGEFAAWFSPFLEIQEVRTPCNGGPGAARQKGLDETDGDFVIFVDADDTLLCANSLAMLERELVYGGLDMAGGHFLEELEDGRFVTHADNLVWMFGKLYRRSFLDRFLIRFNDTRANEDTGFNTLVKALTPHYKFIPQAVYLWHFKRDSITRRESGIYAFDEGHRGYIENMIWAIGEMRTRNLNKELIRSQAVTVLCRLYHMHMGICYLKPLYADASMKSIRAFYHCCLRPMEDMVSAMYLQETFLAEQARCQDKAAGIIAVMTFNEFLAAAREKE